MPPMKKDMTRVLVESAIRRTLKNIQQSPKRMTRNLIDLGLQFSHGRFQTNLLKQAQKMLQDQQSAYYDLVKDLSATVDHDIIATFGVNLGYNSCTKGAVVIRDIEDEKKFNIPWALHVFINQEKLETQPDFYPSLLQQAMELGIYTYLFYVTGDAEQVLPIIKKESDCAFILFLHGHQITPSFINKIKEVKNVMISIYADEDMASACQKLRDARLLYAVNRRYTEQDKQNILSGQWLRSVVPSHPAFAFLRADFACSSQLEQEVYQYVTDVRDQQRYPLIFMDIKYDTLRIDRIISDGECMVGFDEDGNLRTHEGLRQDKQYNIFCHPLEEILQITSKKQGPLLSQQSMVHLARK